MTVVTLEYEYIYTGSCLTLSTDDVDLFKDT